MQSNLLWAGREYESLENCLVDTGPDGAEIRSTIVGLYNGIIYQVGYHIKTNKDWRTVFVDIRCRHSNQEQLILLEGDGNGNWRQDGRKQEAFRGCMDVDIPLTPFTNSLPINRLQLKEKASQEIRVIYLDLLEREIKVVRQKYTRVSPLAYHYENVPNDFEATILVDEQGFVVDYPFLFVRKAALQTQYALS